DYGISAHLFGADSYQASHALSDMADAMGRLGDIAAAFPLHEHALAAAEKALGPEHPLSLAILGTAGVNRLDASDFDAAAALFPRQVAIDERVYGPDESSTATALHNLAIARREQHRLPEARALFERTIRIRTEKLGPEHPVLAQSWFELAETARA